MILATWRKARVAYGLGGVGMHIEIRVAMAPTSPQAQESILNADVQHAQTAYAVIVEDDSHLARNRGEYGVVEKASACVDHFGTNIGRRLWCAAWLEADELHNCGAAITVEIEIEYSLRSRLRVVRCRIMRGEGV